MNLGQMRTLLRRRVQEKIVDQWQDADLNDLLNMGLRRTQLIIKRVHPDSAINRAIRDIVSGTDLYEFPPGFVSEYLVEMLQTDGTYSKIRRVNFRDTVDRSGDAGTENIYARAGKWLRLSPTPTSALVNGIRIWFVPSLTMSADADIPDIPIVLHEGPVIWATRVALGETGEAVLKQLADDWNEFVALVTETYDVTNADPQYLSVDMDKTVF